VTNFLGALQPVVETDDGKNEALPRVCGRGTCDDQTDALKQLRGLYKREYPQHCAAVDDEKRCFGGVFLFDCTPYELMEKAADSDSQRLIREIYENAIELGPFVQA
jgi:hypothetical protein